jgi:hypothetical protein
VSSVTLPPSKHPEDADLDLELLEYVQTLTVEERLERHAQMLEFVNALREAGKDLYGFDPSVVAQAAEGEG